MNKMSASSAKPKDAVLLKLDDVLTLLELRDRSNSDYDDVDFTKCVKFSAFTVITLFRGWKDRIVGYCCTVSNRGL